VPILLLDEEKKKEGRKEGRREGRREGGKEEGWMKTVIWKSAMTEGD
jgi:hypothetical protein